MDPKLIYPLPEGINKHTLKVEQTARWFHIGEDPSSASTIIIALHGYGQHPAYMLGSLKPLKRPGLSIVAPEGMSRFYIKGTDGRVGASWMTRDERLSDIEDHISYLNHWWDSLDAKPNARIIVLGFSQGVATASRWLESGFQANSVIIHSGTIPPEWDEAPEFSSKIENWISIRGLDDSIYPETAHELAATKFKSWGLNFVSLHVEGGHKMRADHIEPHL